MSCKVFERYRNDQKKNFQKEFEFGHSLFISLSFQEKCHGAFI